LERTSTADAASEISAEGPSAVLALHQPLVYPVRLLAGQEHRGGLHERVLRIVLYDHVVQRLQAPALGGLLQAQLHVKVVRDQYRRPELLVAQLLGRHDAVVAVHEKVPVAPLYHDQRLV
jgi:hypothetical protein